MLPGIKNQSTLLAHTTKRFKRNNIYGVYFKKYLSSSDLKIVHRDAKVFVKRLIATPYDTVIFDRYTGSLVSVNGLNENLSHQNFETCRTTFNLRKKPFTCQFNAALGDNQFQVTMDAIFLNGISRYTKTTYTASLMKFIQNKQPYAKNKRFVKFTLEENEYFFLSDNRSVGFDSRFIGPVHAEDIIYEVSRVLDK